MSVPEDAGVCRDCGRIGSRERMVPIERADGYDAYRCPDCAGEQPEEASA